MIRIQQQALQQIIPGLPAGPAFLKKLTGTGDINSILEIDGGYDTLGEILLKSRSDGFYVDVDIPAVAAIATYYLKKVFGDYAVLSGYEESRGEALDPDRLRKSYRAVMQCSALRLAIGSSNRKSCA